MSDEWDEERKLRSMLVMLQREYMDRAKPFVDRLAAIESAKAPRNFIIELTPEQEARLRERFSWMRSMP